MQTVADLPQNYVDGGEPLPEFQFIEDVPASWDETRALDTELGEYVSITRRDGDVWYVGTQTGDSRTPELPLEFIPNGPYVAEVYADAPDASLSNPERVAIERREVIAEDTITAEMARGGGHAVKIFPRDGDYAYRPSLSVAAPERVEDDTATLSVQTTTETVRDPARESGATTATEGVGADLAEPYQRRILAEDEHGVTVETPAGETVAEGSVRAENGSIVLTVPASSVGDLASSELAVLMLGYDGHAAGRVRPVDSEASNWRFGGAEADTAPNVIDVLTPEGVGNDAALASTADQRATIPFRSVGPLPDLGERPAASLDDDAVLEDVDGDGDGDLNDVLTYFQKRESNTVEAHARRFDLDGDGRAGTASDLLRLYQKLF